MPYNDRLSTHSIQNRLLRRLPPKQLDRLIPHLEVVKLPLKKVLQTRGERVEFAFFPETAVVSFFVTLGDGHTVETGWLATPTVTKAPRHCSNSVCSATSITSSSWGRARGG